MRRLERECERLAAIDEARSNIIATKPALNPAIAIDSLAILEETQTHFYFRARILETLEGHDANELNRAWEQAGKWAEKVATFRHAKIAAIKPAGDPNDKIMGEQTLEQLRDGIMQDLEKLADAGVIDLEARCWLGQQIKGQINFAWARGLRHCRALDAALHFGPLSWTRARTWKSVELDRRWRARRAIRLDERAFPPETIHFGSA